MILADVYVNTTAYEAAMQRLRRGVREGFIDPSYGLLPTQGRLLAERCQTFTPPRNVGQGKAAVARDITRIYRPLSHTTFENRSLKKIVRTDDRAAWNKISRNFKDSHGLANTIAIGFSAAWHAKNRISRGRARGLTGKKGGSPKDNLGVVTLGPEGKKARDYLKQTQKHVGWARAGWNRGIIGLGGTVKSSWVSRHGMGQGGVVNATNGPDPYIQVFNSTSWARYGPTQKEGDRIIRNAVAARARDMDSYYFRMMKLAATRAQGGPA